MSALTSLLARDQIVPVRKIEEAIQRQVVSGGELESILLDMGLVPENVMSAYRAALFSLLPATRDEIMHVPRDVVRVVPREVAEQYRLLPLAAEGRTLVVAVHEPLTPDTDEQLAFLLGHDLVYRIVTSVRIAAGLAHHYGIELSPAMRRVAEKLRYQEAGPVPYVRPHVDNKPPGSARGVAPKDGGLDGGTSRGPESERSPATASPSERPGASEQPGASERPGAPTPARVNVSRVVNVGPSQRPSRPPRGMPESEAPPALSSDGSDAPALTATERTATERTSTEKDRSVDAPASRPPETHATEGKASARPGRLRGPMTAKNAVDELTAAEDRDRILEVFFTFTRQFFDCTALFVVHGEDASGWLLAGGREHAIRDMVVPLGASGTLAAVRQSLEPHVGDLAEHPADSALVEALGRLDAQPAVVAPVSIRKRLVLLLYGDRSGESFELRDVPELVAILPRVSEALARIIVRRRARGYGSGDETTRASLKPAANRIAGATEPTPSRSSRPAGYAPSDRPPETHRPWSGETMPAERRRRRGALGVLGVRESAPPPSFAEEEAAEEEVPEEPTKPDGRAAAAVRARGSAGSVPVLDDFPFHESKTSDEPEIAVTRDDDPDEDTAETSSTSAKSAGSAYSLVNAGTDVLHKAAPEAPRPGRRRVDPRTEADEPGTSRRARRRSTDQDAQTPRNPHARTGDSPADANRTPTPFRNEPSIIVNMGDSVEALVDELADLGPDDEDPTVQALLKLGEIALPALAQRFPGPLWFDRHRPHRRLPRGRDLSAIARALCAFRERALPYVASLLSSRDDDTRFYATLLASEFLSLDLLVPLADRIFDNDPGTQVLALDVVKRYGRFSRELEEVLKGIRVEARVASRDPARRRVAVRALGELRDTRALDLLIEILEESDQPLVDAAQHALVTLTRQDFGESSRRWQTWADRNRDKHRIEWLIDGLLHADEETRAATADELKAVTQEYFGYHPASPRREREIAQKKYRTWWEREGRERFAPRA